MASGELVVNGRFKGESAMTAKVIPLFRLKRIVLICVAVVVCGCQTQGTISTGSTAPAGTARLSPPATFVVYTLPG